MPGARPASRAPIHRGTPPGVIVWGLAVALALLAPLAAGVHTLVAHPADTSHAHASHHASAKTCGHSHGAGDADAGKAFSGRSPSEPSHRHNPTAPEDCQICVQLGLAGKCTDIPQPAAAVPSAQLAFRLAPPRAEASASPDSPRAARPRAPPQIA